MGMAWERIVVVVRLTLNRGIALVSMARWIVPGSGSIVRVSCCAQVWAVCTAVVDEVVEFCWRLLVTDAAVKGEGLCYQSRDYRLGWCRAPMERCTRGIPGTRTP